MTVTATTSVAAAVAPGDSSGGASEPTPSTPTAATTSTTPAALTTGPPILKDITAAPKKLVLADVFTSDGWEEGLVSLPGQAAPVQALYSRVDCGRRAMELRFADQSGTLSADVGQGLDSRTSTTLLEFKMLADGRLVDTAVVKFNGQDHLETSLTGIGSVRIEVRYVPGEKCSATAVVKDLTVTPSGS